MEIKNIVFSGIKNPEIYKKAVNSGKYSLRNVTTKNVDFVVTDDIDKPISYSSAKIKIALQYNIPIISYEDFLKRL